MNVRAVFGHGIPLLVAVCAALALLPWIMGASALQSESASLGYTVGMVALFGYPATYQLLIIGWGLCHWRGWALKRFFMRCIWFSLAVFAAAMAWAVLSLREALGP